MKILKKGDNCGGSTFSYSNWEANPYYKCMAVAQKKRLLMSVLKVCVQPCYWVLFSVIPFIFSFWSRYSQVHSHVESGRKERISQLDIRYSLLGKRGVLDVNISTYSKFTATNKSLDCIFFELLSCLWNPGITILGGSLEDLFWTTSRFILLFLSTIK